MISSFTLPCKDVETSGEFDFSKLLDILASKADCLTTDFAFDDFLIEDKEVSFKMLDVAHNQSYRVCLKISGDTVRVLL